MVLPKQRVAGSTPVSRSIVPYEIERPAVGAARIGDPLLFEQTDEVHTTRPDPRPVRLVPRLTILSNGAIASKGSVC